jgi:hypothetical protein
MRKYTFAVGGVCIASHASGADVVAGEDEVDGAPVFLLLGHQRRVGVENESVRKQNRGAERRKERESARARERV